ncbi:MAG: JAB domain-containing protein [Elusimicrobiaceae bacterium]|nr:JAB domain-containing protein [Elusimicrobiaceae bacterium]
MKQTFVKEYTLKSKPTNREAKQLKDSRETYEELRAIFDPETEALFESSYVLYLNQDQRLKGFMRLSDGGLTHVIVDPRKIMMGAIGSLATAIILSHNHPSGNPRPSEEDRRLTQKLLAACKLMDICFIDHIIMGSGCYYSFRDHGEMMY